MVQQTSSASNLGFWEKQRQNIAFYLDDIETPLGKTLNLTLTGIILISLASFIAQTYPLSPSIRSRLEGLDFMILISFTIEYIIRFWAAENKKKFVLNPL